MRHRLPGYNPLFDDWYFTPDEGWEESRHVFLEAQGFPARFLTQSRWRIAELGFGLGMNLWVLLDSFVALDGPSLSFRSFEAHAPDQDFLALSLSPYSGRFHSLGGLDGILEAYESLRGQGSGWGPERQLLPGVDVQVYWGDALEGLKKIPPEQYFDAWFLDGHDPKKNPGLWSPQIMTEVAGHSRAGTRASTYSAAGQVKRLLREHGFDVRRIPGYGRKRHMCLAHFGEGLYSP